MDKPRDFKILLYMRARLYSMETGVSHSWIAATNTYIPIVIVEERTTGTFIMYGVNRGKIAVNIRINLNTTFNKVSTFFGNLKNNDSRQNVGLSFPPDGSIESFREKVDAIKKHLITIPSLRQNLKPISVTIAKYSYAPISTVIETALAKERFPAEQQTKDDAKWIHQQIENGSFIPPPPPPPKQLDTGINRQTARRSNSRPAFVVSKRMVGLPDGNRASSRMNQTTIHKKILAERELIEKQLDALKQEKLILDSLGRNNNKTGNPESSKGRAQAMRWQNHLASAMDNPDTVKKDVGTHRETLPRKPLLLGLHKKEKELRKLRIENGIGDYVRALQALQEEHEDLDVKIATLKKERQDMQQTIFNLSTGLSTYVTGLIKTDQFAFHNLDRNLFGLNDKLEDQPPDNEHKDPIGMAAEKLKNRRLELEERAAIIASQAKFLGKSVAAYKRKSDQASKRRSRYNTSASSSKSSVGVERNV